MLSTEGKLKQVMADLFGLDPSCIDESASVDTIEKWDSLNHLKLVLALEEQFNVTFSGEQSVEMLSYELVKTVLSENGVAFS
jgi:acyl carrier protein